MVNPLKRDMSALQRPHHNLPKTPVSTSYFEEQVTTWGVNQL